MEKIPSNELDIVLGHIFKDIRKKNGDEYEPDSLTAFQSSINRNLQRGYMPKLLQIKVLKP